MNESVKAKYIIKATLKSESPFLIGKGSGEDTDIDVMLRNGQPYIPASSFAGVLRSHFDFNKSDINEELEYFWGSGDSNLKNSKQSHIIFQDLLPATPATSQITVRDGIKIVPETGIVKKGGKYDFQCVEYDGVFNLNAEITVRNCVDDIESIEKIIADIHYVLDNDFQIGAFTTTGFGKMKLKDFKVYKYAFPESADRWFEFLAGNDAKELLWESLYFKEKQHYKPKFITNDKFLKITFDFSVKNTLLIGGSGTRPDESDKKYLESFNEPVISGKSIKGALRHRALQILNTIGIKAEDFLQNMMGWVDDVQNDKAKTQKSRLYIEKIQLLNTGSFVHNRNKIDRFTGGAMDGALFNSEVVYDKVQTKHHQLILKLKNYSEAEAGLLLLLMKDLWTEDLAIGGEKNIGRGVLTGHRISIKLPKRQDEIVLEENAVGKLEVSPKEKIALLEGFVAKLQEEAKSIKV